MTRPNCKARQHSDQMACSCGLAWDMNDPEPPECRQGVVARQELAAMRVTLQEPSRYASVQKRLLKLAEMPLRWLPTANINDGLYLVRWDSLPDAVFVMVSSQPERPVNAKRYRFFNERGTMMLVVERTEHPATAFRYRYADGEWSNE